MRDLWRDFNWHMKQSGYGASKSQIIYGFVSDEVDSAIMRPIEDIVGYCIRSYMSIQFSLPNHRGIGVEIISKIEEQQKSFTHLNKKSILKSLSNPTILRKKRK